MVYTNVRNMRRRILSKAILIINLFMVICTSGFAFENQFRQARTLQREGRFDEAIEAFKGILLQPIEDNELADKDLAIFTDALVQLMNTFQSMGKPEQCITTLQNIFNESAILQQECLRDYNSVLGYALSRTEKMDEAEEAMLKALTLPLHSATHERYFRDYAYAAAVFYSNPKYQKEVVNWCHEALKHAESCNNTSGKQWVTAMLGSLYKREGDLNKALELFQKSKDEAKSRNDELGVLNSLHTLVDLFLFWDIPEYANIYASEAISFEKNMKMKNPMVSAQTYINKGRALRRVGKIDSIAFYNEQARRLCESLPYNSGMVDVNLLDGIYLTEKGGDSLDSGIKILQHVAEHGTVANKAKAYHQLAQTYLKTNNKVKAELMLDSLYTLLAQNDSPTSIIHIEYEPILNHYMSSRNHVKLEQYLQLLIQEQQSFKKNKVNSSLVGAIVDFQTGKRVQELRIKQLTQSNQRLWLTIALAISIIISAAIAAYLFYQKNQHMIQMRKADDMLESLTQQLDQSNSEKQKTAQEIKEFLSDKDKRQELETLTPFILKESGETKFRQYFEMLHPLFLHRLRERVPSVTRREELLSMLIVLKQDNKKIAELLAIAPRSVLMLRHRFRQKIGMDTEYSLENFIDQILGLQDDGSKS